MTRDDTDRIDSYLGAGILISAMSCWEVALLERSGRLKFSEPLDVWLECATAPRSVTVLDITRSVLVESTRLPEGLHRDPADRILVAQARAVQCPLVTYDARILNYPHVHAIRPSDIVVPQ